MLADWTVVDFKPIRGRMTLPLSPLTVLVGANSSGKSSIIQSILLLKQTLQYATSDRSLALNGPILKLGEFHDVKNKAADTNQFGIGWRYDENYFRATLPNQLQIYQSEAIYTPFSRHNITNVSCELDFGLPKSTADLQLASLKPRLFSCKISAGSLNHESPPREIASFIEFGLGDDSASPLSFQRPSGLSSTGRGISQELRPITRIDPDTEAAALEDYPEGQIAGAIVRYFFPWYIAVKYDPARQAAARIAETICSLRFSGRRSEFSDLAAPTEVVNIVEAWIRANADVLSRNPYEQAFGENRVLTIGDITNLLQHIYASFRRRAYSQQKASFPSMQEIQPQIYEAILRNLEPGEEIALETPRQLSEASTRMRHYFSEYVHYLGPLRDDPKPLYPLEVLASPTDVGFRGEHTAAVLDLNAHRRIRYIPSAQLRDWEPGDPINSKTVSATLKEGVVDWLSYLDVAVDIRSADLGKIGHQLGVKTVGLSDFLDLTNVGVGVSQVIPIVVTALLAQPGSLLIFEQPELHLHPRVQARLGDFFLSVSLTGKQCLIETHSEYLLHRLRRRIAEAPGDELERVCALYFVERVSGSTRCRPVKISRYGAISEWPQDFFDQAQEEGERVIAAALKKRSVESSNPKKAP